MNNLKTGQFYGSTNETIRLKGVTLTDTEYTHEKVDWHFHENAYFTFILEGELLEGNKKEQYDCNAGSILFHNKQEAHYNIKPDGFTRGFHIELNPKWFDSYEIDTCSINGTLNIVLPQMKALMYNIFKEAKLSREHAQPAIDFLLIELFSLLSGIKITADRKTPGWVYQIRDLLNDDTEDKSLTELAMLINIHPVHLSRDFSKYYNCNLGEYIRSIKIQRALTMMTDKRLSLTEIAFSCNFADQSHFIRSFKAKYHIPPSYFRKFLLRKQKC